MTRGKSREIGMNITFQTEKKQITTNQPIFFKLSFYLPPPSVQRFKHIHHRYLPLSSGPRQKGKSCNLFGKTSPPSWSSGDSDSDEIDRWIFPVVHYCTLFLCCLDGEIDDQNRGPIINDRDDEVDQWPPRDCKCLSLFNRQMCQSGNITPVS